jgi:hypothetical protein
MNDTDNLAEAIARFLTSCDRTIEEYGHLLDDRRLANFNSGRQSVRDLTRIKPLLTAAPDLIAFAQQVIREHRAQLPSETRDLYGGGCGCSQCEAAHAALAKAGAL